MLDIEQAKEKLQDRVATRVAKSCGLHSNTVIEIKSGKRKTVSVETLQKLTAYFDSTDTAGASNE